MSEGEIPARLTALSSNFYADFTKMDLDAPVPYFVTRGEQGSLAGFAQWGTGKMRDNLRAF